MSNYIYSDEDNQPMHRDERELDKSYKSYEQMVKDAGEEPLPFTDPPENGCWNCMSYDWKHEACTTNWNNMDESYYNPDIDDRDPDDHCEYWELNPDAEWEDWHDR